MTDQRAQQLGPRRATRRCSAKPTERAFTDSFLSTAGPSAEAELPVGWESAVSNSTGETYYINADTGESTYERPTAPAGEEEGIVV